MKKILISNDDGIDGKGLEILIKQLRSSGEVFTVVPDRPKSASSHAITLYKPLTVREISKNLFVMDGTPADCVRFGVLELLKKVQIDIVVSGVNEGPNLGDDVFYSGTVAAAREGALFGLPSVAVSLSFRTMSYSMGKKYGKRYFDSAAKFTDKLVKYILKTGLPRGVYLNVNIPDKPYKNIRGVEVVQLGQRIYQDEIVKSENKKGEIYWWVKGGEATGKMEKGTDIYAVDKNKISITPLLLDITDHLSIKAIKNLESIK